MDSFRLAWTIDYLTADMKQGRGSKRGQDPGLVYLRIKHQTARSEENVAFS